MDRKIGYVCAGLLAASLFGCASRDRTDISAENKSADERVEKYMNDPYILKDPIYSEEFINREDDKKR